MQRRKHLLIALGLVASAALPALAQGSWPARPVTIIVPYPAGAGVDPVARLVAQKLAERWKQPVLVDNRAGASGTIGANAVAKAAPDGHTILMSATAEVVINQHFMKGMAYNPETDLRPVTLAVQLPFALVAHPARPYTDIAGLLLYARQNPGKVSYASSGAGTPQHLAGVMLEQLAGVSLLHVPFKGVALAMNDIVAGQVDIGFAGLPTALAQVQGAKVRALGLSSKTASPAAPQIAPLGQHPDLAGFDLMQWFGVFLPGKTSDAITQQVQRDIADVLALPDVRDTLQKQGAEPSGMPTAAFETFVRQQRELFRKVVQAARIEQ